MTRAISFSLFLIMMCAQADGQQTVGLFSNTPLAYDGYTLFAPVANTETYLIDNCGEKVHSWPSSYVPALSCYLLENGMLLRTGRQPTGPFANVELIDWNGNVLWNYDPNPTYGRRHHDVEALPNGNILMIVYDVRTSAEVAQIGGFTTQTTVNCEQILEVQPDTVTGGTTVVWEWKVWDHLIQDQNASLSNFGDISANPGKIDLNSFSTTNSDWLHFNGIAYNEALDQILISGRNGSEIWVIDHSTTTAEAASSSGGLQNKGGDLLYRWGNPEQYDQGTVNDQKLFSQHHAHWIEDGFPDEGKIMVFSNKAGTPQGVNSSAIHVIDPPVDISGAYAYNGMAYGPANFDWTYQASVPTDFYSSNVSGSQRMPNGNTLICEGATGRMFEVDASGNTVWEYMNPVNDTGPVAQNTPISVNALFRCLRYAPDYAGLAGRDLTPQGYIETGSTFSCSLFSVDDGPEQIIDDGLSIYPNPADRMVRITSNGSASPQAIVALTDVNGKACKVISRQLSSTEFELGTADLSPGIYFISITDAAGTWREKLVVSR